MTQRFINKSSLSITLLLVMILVFGLVQPAAAQGIVYGNIVPVDTVSRSEPDPDGLQCDN